MTYKEAHEIISCIIELGEAQKQDMSAEKMALTAIDKQMPKKVLPDTVYCGLYTCPACKAKFVYKGTNYCGNCGQALKWEDT